jgi:hypothetical protein
MNTLEYDPNTTTITVNHKLPMESGVAMTVIRTDELDALIAKYAVASGLAFVFGVVLFSVLVVALLS